MSVMQSSKHLFSRSLKKLLSKKYTKNGACEVLRHRNGGFHRIVVFQEITDADISILHYHLQK